MPNRKERKAQEASKSHKKYFEFLKQKEAEAKKRLDLISSLQSARSELLNKHAEIQSDIELNIKEHTQRLEKIMKQFVMEVKENPSTELPQFQINESFTSLVSDSNRKLEEISKQIKFIDDLIQKVSSDSPDILLSEHEQKIIKILSANSFFRSQDVASVQKMIDSCPNMQDCLERLGTYSNEFLSKMWREIRAHKMNPELFNVDSADMLKLEHKKLDELLQELSELNEEIEKGKNYFSTKTFAECIFSINFDEFSSISEDTQTLGDRIKEMNKRFSEIKKSFVEFVENQISCRKDFAREVHREYEEPIVGLRQNLERSLKQIKEIRV